MSLSREDVELIARLARLSLTEGELQRFPDELSRIVNYVSALQTLDTAGVAPLTHAVPMDLRLVADEAGTALPVETALSQAPVKNDDCFRVPHIIPPAGRK